MWYPMYVGEGKANPVLDWLGTRHKYWHPVAMWVAAVLDDAPPKLDFNARHSLNGASLASQ